ncbi:BURP domain protein RD22-like [Abrus precatorius]|uniref:BURP domain protein RD22-like n=1 Tax=Abrus precatorius TaxID=3816 RepID=A0A8B8JFE2_ABRPR|nr:BURP domain protein RD22-like [Abrus precatorius]
MEFSLLSILTLLNFALVVTHAALPPEVYWKSKLPSTPMPKAITDLLHPDLVEEESTSVAVGKGGVNVDAGKTKPGGTSVNVGKGGVNVNVGKGKPKGTSVNVGKGGVNVHTGKKGKPPVHVAVGKSPFDYVYAASETQLHDDPNVALFFLEKDLHSGKKLNLHFTKTLNSAAFLPRQVADSIPFSSKKVDDVFTKFSIKPDSNEGQTVKNTINECEGPSIRGEEKSCVTSLESMVDFSTSKLGNNVEAVSTEVNKESELQQYTIAKGVKKLGENKAVVCHKQSYPYAVFYCHKSDTTKAYSVPLVGADRTRLTAVSVCHTDTSQWNPKHLAFQVLNVQPGTVPVCHFLPEDHVVFVPK